MNNLRTVIVIKITIYMAPLVSLSPSNVFLYRPFQNSNNKRSVTPGSATVDFSTEAQDMFNTLCIPAGYCVVKKTFFL